MSATRTRGRAQYSLSELTPWRKQKTVEGLSDLHKTDGRMNGAIGGDGKAAKERRKVEFRESIIRID
jgi:hypothetical protein